MDDDKVKEIAFKIAVALQKKFNGTLAVRTEYLRGERLLIEYSLEGTDGAVAQTAYAQSFFEDITKEKASWLATRVYTELKERETWTQKHR